MLLSFNAKQKLKLSVTRNKEYLSKYLLEEERVVGAMLDSKKLEPEGDLSLIHISEPTRP